MRSTHWADGRCRATCRLWGSSEARRGTLRATGVRDLRRLRLPAAQRVKVMAASPATRTWPTSPAWNSPAPRCERAACRGHRADKTFTAAGRSLGTAGHHWTKRSAAACRTCAHGAWRSQHGPSCSRRVRSAFGCKAGSRCSPARAARQHLPLAGQATAASGTALAIVQRKPAWVCPTSRCECGFDGLDPPNGGCPRQYGSAASRTACAEVGHVPHARLRAVTP